MVSADFASALAARRREFNALVAEARRRYPGFDQARFTHFLVEAADPVIQAVAESAPGCVSAAASSAFQFGLDMVGQGLVDGSPRTQGLTKAWATVMPRYARLVARAPDETFGMLSNAILHLEALPGVNTQRWARDMAILAPQVESVAHLRALGQVLAWRAGAAHYRRGAISAADTLPEALVLAAFRASAPASWQQVRTDLLRDPWWRAPADCEAVGMRSIGAFSGFGGMFSSPPLVFASDACFLVHSGGRDFVLHADAHGAVLLPASAGEAGAAVGKHQVVHHVVLAHEVLVDQQRIALDLPAEGLAVCANDSTIAISSPYTHAIRLVERQ